VSDRLFLPCGAPDDWNASESGHPAVFEDDNGRVQLFFQGNRNRGHLVRLMGAAGVVW